MENRYNVWVRDEEGFRNMGVKFGGSKVCFWSGFWINTLDLFGKILLFFVDFKWVIYF